MSKAKDFLKLLENVCNEEDVTLDSLKDLVQDLKKMGYDDETKLQGMLDKAKEIAKEQEKEGDRETIIGIFQGFFQAK